MNSYYDKFGHQIGGDVWSRSHIRVATDEEIEEVEQELLILATIKKMVNFRGTLEYADAVKIYNILKKY